MCSSLTDFICFKATHGAVMYRNVLVGCAVTTHLIATEHILENMYIVIFIYMLQLSRIVHISLSG
jgi:hypothetical protein